MRWAGALLQVPLPPGHPRHRLHQLEEGSAFLRKDPPPSAQNRRNLTARSEKPALASPPTLPRLQPRAPASILSALGARSLLEGAPGTVYARLPGAGHSAVRTLESATRAPRGQPGAGGAAAGRKPARLGDEQAGEPWTRLLGSGAALPSSPTPAGAAPTHPATPRHRLRREGGAAAARGGRGGRRGGRDCEGDAPQRWPGAPPLGGSPTGS